VLVALLQRCIHICCVGITLDPTSALTSLQPFAVAADGLLPASAEVELRLIGLNPDGELYFYGPSPKQPGTTIHGAIGGLVLDISISRHGQAGQRGDVRWDGDRDHLDVRLQTPVPNLVHLLRLPAHRSQWHYRSLLGCLATLPLSDTPVKLEAKRGRDATFFQVSLDPEGQQRVTAPTIGPSRDDLEIAVNACRRALGLPPQRCDRLSADS
jgi:hypothetical protein